MLELESDTEQPTEERKDLEYGVLIVPKPSTKVAPKILMTRFARATQTSIAEVGNPPLFQPLVIFFQHLELGFIGIWRDWMQAIQDFRKQKDDTPRTMYAILKRLSCETEDAFM